MGFEGIGGIVKLRILVWGAGPVGLYLGARLEDAGQDVYFLGRRKVLEPLEGRLFIEEEGGKREYSNLRFLFNLEDVEDITFDWVIISFKSHHNLAVAPQLKELRVKKALVVQNGIGNEEFYRDFLPQVASGAFTKVVHFKEGVLKASKGGLGLAPKELVEDLFLLLAPRFPVLVFDDYRPMKWSKLLLNILGSPIACALNLHPQDYLSQKKGIFLEKTLLNEFLGLIRKLGIPRVNLPGYPIKLFSLLPYLPNWVFKKISGARGEKLPSLLADLRDGRPLEIGALLLNPLKEGKRIGHRMPLASLLYEVISEKRAISLNSLFEEYRKRNQGSFSGSG